MVSFVQFEQIVILFNSWQYGLWSSYLFYLFEGFSSGQRSQLGIHSLQLYHQGSVLTVLTKLLDESALVSYEFESLPKIIGLAR